MSRIWSTFVVCTALALSSPGSTATRAAEPSAFGNPDGQVVMLTVESSAGFVASGAASGTMLLSTGGWVTGSIRLGPSGCQNGGTFGAGFGSRALASPEALADAAAVWTISARLVSTEEDRATVDLRWHRDVRPSSVVPDDSVDATRRIELRVGRRGVMDLVTGDPAQDQCESFAILLGLKMQPFMAADDAAIAYDLWLIQRQIDGQETLERFTATGRQGDNADFFFRTLDYTSGGLRLEDSSNAELHQYIGGSVTGTLFDTDRIDLTIDVMQNVGYSGGTVGSGGRKRLTVRNGETVQFDLPSSIGGHISKLGDVGRIFKGQRTAIRLTPRVLWSRTRNR